MPASVTLKRRKSWLLAASALAPLSLAVSEPALPKRPRLRATAVLASAALNLAARIAIPAIVLNGVSGMASAQDATWVGTTSDWNTPANWNPTGVPTGTAVFNPSPTTGITFSAPSTAVQTLSFNAPAYTFNLPSTSLSITGSGIQASLANAPTFNVSFPALVFTNSSTAGPAILNAFNTGPIAFLDNSNAGTATIKAGNAASNSTTDPNGFTGGFVFFRGSSTAADAKITSFWASNIEFQDTSKAGNAIITAPTNGGSIFFENASSADHATITMLDGTGELSFAPGFFGGGTATAGNATIINNGKTNFFQDSSAGNATITTNAGGITSFFGRSTGGNATFITNAGGILDISTLGTFPDTGEPTVSVPGMTAGSIEGAGNYFLGSKTLTVGSNNLSTTVSGIISDGGASGGTGGSLVKVGAGTLTLSGANTYSGTTSVNAGTLQAGATNTFSPNSSVTVANGGTLVLNGFNQTVPSVTNAGLVNMGTGTAPGTVLTTTRYTGTGGTIAMNTFLGSDGSPSDKLVINGGTASGNSSLRITNAGGPGAAIVADGILVVQAINGGSTTAGAFSAHPVSAGAFDYFLFRGGISPGTGDNWYLRNEVIAPPIQPPITPPTTPTTPPTVPTTPPTPGPGEPPLPEAIPGAPPIPLYRPEVAVQSVLPTVAHELMTLGLGTFNERQGDQLLINGSPSVGAWGRVFGQHKSEQFAQGAQPDFDGTLAGFQAGSDLWLSESGNGHRDHVGFYVTKARATGSVSGLVDGIAGTPAGHVDLDATSFGGYWTHLGPSNWYIDTVVQGSYLLASTGSINGNGTNVPGVRPRGFNRSRLPDCAGAVADVRAADTGDRATRLVQQHVRPGLDRRVRPL